MSLTRLSKTDRRHRDKTIFGLKEEGKIIPSGFYALIQVCDEVPGSPPRIFLRKFIDKGSAHKVFFDNYFEEMKITAAGECFIDSHGEIFAWSNHTGTYYSLFENKTTSEIITMFALPASKFYRHTDWEIAKEKMVWEKQDSHIESKSIQQADLLKNGSLVPGRRFIDVADKMAMNLGFVISKESRIKLDVDPPAASLAMYTHPPIKSRRLERKPQLYSSSTDLLAMLATSSLLDKNEQPVSSIQTASSLSQFSSPVVSSLFASTPQSVLLPSPKAIEQEIILNYKV